MALFQNVYVLTLPKMYTVAFLASATAISFQAKRGKAIFLVSDFSSPKTSTHHKRGFLQLFLVS